MENIVGDLWELAQNKDVDAVVITTNGFVKPNGEAVLGKGIALSAKEKWPDLPRRLGGYLVRFGNRPFRFRVNNFSPDLVTLPTKPAFTKDGKPGWYTNSDLELILLGALDLVEMADKFAWQKVLLPRPGVGAGGLDWGTVEPALASVLDERFICVSLP